jgi:hypothetical protein
MISHDGGRNWAPSNGGYSGRRAYAIVPDREKPGRVYATTINTATGGGSFYVSNDAGETWQLSARNMPPRLIAYSILQDRATRTSSTSARTTASTARPTAARLGRRWARRSRRPGPA